MWEVPLGVMCATLSGALFPNLRENKNKQNTTRQHNKQICFLYFGNPWVQNHRHMPMILHPQIRIIWSLKRSPNFSGTIFLEKFSAQPNHPALLLPCRDVVDAYKA